MGLLNLSPEGTLAFELPRVSLELTSRFGRRRQTHDPACLATVLIEPDERRLSLVCQSSLRVAAPDADYLDVTEVVEGPGSP